VRRNVFVCARCACASLQGDCVLLRVWGSARCNTSRPASAVPVQVLARFQGAVGGDLSRLREYAASTSERAEGARTEMLRKNDDFFAAVQQVRDARVAQCRDQTRTARRRAQMVAGMVAAAAATSVPRGRLPPLPSVAVSE
jgi:hypothetical protein